MSVSHILKLQRPLQRGSRFLRDASGAAAVEFALVVTPFLALVGGVLGIGVDHYAYARIEQATRQSVQEIRTGAAQIRQLTREQFRDEIFCPKLQLLSCDRAVFNVVVVRTNADWAAFTPTTVDPAAAKWCTGNPREVVLVQVAYPAPVSSISWTGATSVVDGQRYYLVSAGFRNEPFGVPNPAAPGCA